MWWPGKRKQTDFSEEIKAHIAMEIDRLRAEGIGDAEARAQALREFGNVTAVEERYYETGRGVAVLESVASDVRYGIRVLAKSPAFTLVAVLSLALGIGANVAIFQLVDSVRLRMLPVKDPQELAEVRLTDMSEVRGSRFRDNSLTYPVWDQIRSRQHVLSGIFAWANTMFNLAPTGEIQMARGLLVSGEFFSTLGIRPIAGRVFTTEDDRKGCGFPGAVISYDYWQRAYGGEPNTIGSSLHIGAHPVTVIGITPPNFFGLEVGQTFAVALPLCSSAALSGVDPLDTGMQWWLTVMGRLKPGSSLETATSSFRSLSPAVFEASLPPRYPPVSVKKYLALQLTALPAGSGISGLRDQYSHSLWFLLAIAAAVLLIACANLANLMLARSSAREKEIAVRLAIGASRGRLMRQLLTESLLVASAGALLGLLIARGLSRILVSLLTTQGSSLVLNLEQDWRVIAFATALAILTCLLFGLAPAMRTSRSGPGDALKAGSRSMSASRERFGLRRGLVIVQVALSLMLLVDALLFVKTLTNLLTADPGFHPEGVLIANVDFNRQQMPLANIAEFRRQLLNRVRAIPGVTSATDTNIVPLSGAGRGNAVWMDRADSASGKECRITQVGDDYFNVLQTPMLAGRSFNERDSPTGPKVAIVNEEFARQFTNGANPVGKRFWIEATPSEPATLFEIVGLVRNTKYLQLRESFAPILFLPIVQDPSPTPQDQLLIRSSLPFDRLTGSVRQALSQEDPAIRYTFRVFDSQIRDSLLQERLMATLSSSFGLLAGLLAAIGLYGVMSYMVAQRKNEIGIRMALGAGRGKILNMVLRESGALVAIGLVAGAMLSIGAAATLKAMMFGVSAYDPTSLLAAGAGLAFVALAASYLPARRASRVEPMIALRKE